VLKFIAKRLAGGAWAELAELFSLDMSQEDLDAMFEELAAENLPVLH
jgi:hypothetical protein